MVSPFFQHLIGLKSISAWVHPVRERYSNIYCTQGWIQTSSMHRFQWTCQHLIKKWKKLSPYTFSTVYTIYFMCLRDQVLVFCDISLTKRVTLTCVNIDKTCRYVGQEVNRNPSQNCLDPPLVLIIIFR